MTDVVIPRFAMRTPVDLCPAHRKIWLGWRDLTYNPRNPTEWPGGSHIMDSRTTHVERARKWDVKSREQMTLTEACCRSGRSPQCDRPAAPAPVEVLPVGAPVESVHADPFRVRGTVAGHPAPGRVSIDWHGGNTQEMPATAVRLVTLMPNHQCRLCGRWLEGEWNRAAPDSRDRDELQRQMDAGRCDVCPSSDQAPAPAARMRQPVPHSLSLPSDAMHRVEDAGRGWLATVCRRPHPAPGVAATVPVAHGPAETWTADNPAGLPDCTACPADDQAPPAPAPFMSGWASLLPAQ
jgi:hypothetical protein